MFVANESTIAWLDGRGRKLKLRVGVVNASEIRGQRARAG
jgi:hypothetical protein